MLEGIYTWVRSLAGYFLFVTVLEQLLPGKKYGKYVRLFSGMVLILLVVQPLTDKTQMEAKIAHDYETLLFQYEAGDLKKEILGMEHQRLEQMIRQYEKAVEEDIRLMAEDSGVKVEKCQVSICSDQENEQFGTVTAIRLSVYSDSYEGKQDVLENQPGTGQRQPGDDALAAARIDPVQPVTVEIDGSGEKVRQNADDNGEAEAKMTDQEAAVTGTVNPVLVPGLRRKIAAYYNLEEAYVEVQIVEGKR